MQSVKHESKPHEELNVTQKTPQAARFETSLEDYFDKRDAHGDDGDDEETDDDNDDSLPGKLTCRILSCPRKQK